MGKSDDQPLTKKDLLDALAVQETRIVEKIRDEFDSKLSATENRINEQLTKQKGEFEELLSEQTLELTSAISEMVEPMQKTDEDHEVRITRLEQKAA